ncbi:MAG: rod shape-determining protein MreC [Bacteroidota bacterium]
MKSLFLFLYKFRAFISLVLLEAICAVLIIQNSQYHRAIFFNSSNTLIGSTLTTSDNIVNYFKLKEINKALASDNARLKNSYLAIKDSTNEFQYDSAKKYHYINAKVINNSVNLRNNLLTINIGSENGVKKDMGVIGGRGIVGKTRYVSKHFTVVTSLLHTESMVPATIKDKVNLCTVQWSGVDPYLVDLLYVPRHYTIEEGDSVLTTGYSGIFPENILIGKIHSVDLTHDAPFYNIKVKLINDFYKISFVEVTEFIRVEELDSIQNMAQ